MSVVVAFKYKDGIIIGADKRVSKGMRLREDNTSKISLTKYSKHGIGSVGLLRHCNLLSIKDELMDYEDILAGVEVDQAYVVAKIVPNLIKYFGEQQAIMSESGTTVMASEVMYVTPNKIFVIGEDFSVMEYPVWAAIGCGEEMVMGLLCNVEPPHFEKLKEADAIDLMSGCITYACEKDSAVSENFEFILIGDPKAEPPKKAKKKAKVKEVVEDEKTCSCGEDCQHTAD